ncbi:MAG: hypothetical protein AB1749_15310 [Pseudomonadota bacterium]
MLINSSLSKHAVHSAEFRSRGPGSYEGLHGLVPVLLGLAAPAMAAAVVGPGLLGEFATYAIYGLSVLLVLATSAFVIALLGAGRVTSASFDAEQEIVELVNLGLFANVVWRINFADVANVRMAVGYDDNGGKILQPVLELNSGKRVALPAETSWNDLEVIRNLVGTRGDPNLAAWEKKRQTRFERRRPARFRHD